MKAEDYTATQATLIEIARLNAQLDLDSFVQAIGYSETVAPMLDPTLYMRGASRLEHIKRLAQAANTFRKVASEEIEALREIVIRGMAKEEERGQTD